MLTKTSITALQTLLYLHLTGSQDPVAPGDIAERLEASASYVAKINTALVKAGILRAHRGVKGGVTLARTVESITLREIVEACQGQIRGDYCAVQEDLASVCAFHQAMHELQQANMAVLARWTVADIAAKPCPAPGLKRWVSCRIAGAAPGPSNGALVQPLPGGSRR